MNEKAKDEFMTLPCARTESTVKTSHSSLLSIRSRLALIARNTMQHNLIRILRIISSITLVPVVRNSISENAAIVVEVCAGDAAADFRVAFETVLGVLVPEVECAVATGGAEGSVDGVEGD
jgi:hypothetical protein